MVKVIAFVLAAILVVLILGSIAFVGVKVFDYVMNQNFDFGTAWAWAVDDFKELIVKNTNGAEAEDYFEYEYSINKWVNVVGCTSLK